MPSELVAEETITVGQPVVEGRASKTLYGVVFEDDGETGYFLCIGLQPRGTADRGRPPHLQRRADRAIPSVVQIAFSADGLMAALIINEYPHAIIDFAAKRSYSRTGFPPPGGE